MNYFAIDIANGDFNLSKHFAAHEFQCKDGSTFIFVASELVQVLENCRVYYNKPIIINSGFRTYSHNANTPNASKHSKHCLGMAADVYINGVSQTDLYNYFNNLYPNKYGMGIYNSFVHIDIREVKARWNYSSNK